MPFYIIRQDITKMEVDAIVNPTQSEPIIGGSTDYYIHEVAGEKLLEERKAFGFIKTSHAVLTKGYNLASKYVIHTVGPKYIDGKHHERRELINTYKACLDIAFSHDLLSLAFPLISSGHFGYPKDKALDIAISTIKNFLNEHEMTIYLVVYDDESFAYSTKLFKDVKSYINYNFYEENSISASYFEPDVNYAVRRKARDLNDTLKEIKETFTQKLFRFIKQKRLDEVEVYKNANMTRQHFSKIRSDDQYQPKKETAIALAIGLKLNLDETNDLLQSCGYALSQSNYFDLIIKYFIEVEMYDIYEINLVLYEYDQKQLGTI